LQLGLKTAEIEAVVNNVKYGKNGSISAEEFMKQIAAWANKGAMSDRPTQSAKLKAYLSKILAALKSHDTTLESAFSEVDKDKDGAITASEHYEFVLRVGIDLSKLAPPKLSWHSQMGSSRNLLWLH
jgi:Ca2+-binding EF-hand superfamily protein